MEVDPTVNCDPSAVDWDDEHFVEVIGSKLVAGLIRETPNERRPEIKLEPDDEEPFLDVGGFLELETLVKDESAPNMERRGKRGAVAVSTPSSPAAKIKSTSHTNASKHGDESNQEIPQNVKKRLKKGVNKYSILLQRTSRTQKKDSKEDGHSRSFICLLCDNRFLADHDLYSHNLSVHSTSKVSTCAFCEAPFDNVATFKAHLKTHLFLSARCRICLKSSYSSSKSASNFECEACRVVTDKVKKNGVLNNGGSKVNCPLCSKVCVSLANLRGHMRTHRHDTIQCNICGKTFTERHTLVQHVKLHSGVRPFKCETCGQTFTRASHLKQHGNTHVGDRPFECASCNKTFTLKSSLIRHMTTHRLGSEEISRDRRFMCEVCGKAFKQSATLKSHAFVHSDGAKPFACLSCDRCFARKGSLRVHMKSHSGTQRFECVECGKAFTTKGKLTIHARAHSGALPYQCTTCGKAFSQSSALKQHSWTHSGFRPLECPVCSKGFIRKIRLKDHLKLCAKYNS